MRSLIGASLTLFASLMLACSSTDPSAADPNADPPGDNADTASDVASQLDGRWETARYYESQPELLGYPPGFVLNRAPNYIDLTGMSFTTKGITSSCTGGDPLYWRPVQNDPGLCICEPPTSSEPGCPSGCSQGGTWKISGVKKPGSYYQGTFTFVTGSSDACFVLSGGKTYAFQFDFDPQPSYNDAPTLKLYDANDSVHGGDGHEWDYELVAAQ
jgi:hypothetical protein